MLGRHSGERGASQPRITLNGSSRVPSWIHTSRPGCTHLAGLRYTIEEINDPSFQRILGADDEQSLILDDALEDL